MDGMEIAVPGRSFSAREVPTLKDIFTDSIQGSDLYRNECRRGDHVCTLLLLGCNIYFGVKAGMNTINNVYSNG